MSSDELFFDLDYAAAISGLTRKRIRELIRAGAPFTGANRPPRRRYNETDLRILAVIAEIASEFDLPAPDAVKFWADLSPDGTWPAGSNHVLFSLDGEPVARIYPGQIAARIARRILAQDIAKHDQERLSGAGDVAPSGVDYPDAVTAPRIARPASPRQTFLIVPANVFHPARLNRAPIKEST